jgi:UDP-glucose 4-epimerase
MTVLVTGGAGYIGSHTCIELLEAGYSVVVLDNLSNSNPESLSRVMNITDKTLEFVQGDIRDRACLKKIFADYKISSVIHFAGLKAVGESCEMPMHYYDNNVYGTIVLTQEMETAGVKKLVFSSSATVYGDPETLPLTEDMPLSATNPYGRSKLIIEDMLRDLQAADKLNKPANPWAITLLRYFNPVGAHESGQIGEDPNGIPNNLMPFITQVAVGKRKQLSVFGGDYDTVDGTGVRDYIHVVDLAKGHVKSIATLENGLTGVQAINLGTGNGQSVLQLVKAFEQENKIKIPYEISARRPGDVAACYADAGKAKALLDWQAELDVNAMVKDSWHWQSNNPNGYE